MAGRAESTRFASLPGVSSPLARLLESPHSSTTSRRYGLARNRKFIALGAAALSVTLFLVLRDLTAFSTQPEVWELATPPPPPLEAVEPITRTVVATVTSILATTFSGPTVTTTLSAPAVVETVQVAPRVEPVVFVLIAWSEDAASEAALLIKVRILRVSQSLR